MKKLIIEVNQDLSEAKKAYNKFRFAIYSKVSNNLYNYMKRKFRNQYMTQKTEHGFIAIDTIEDDKIKKETEKLDAFLNGEYTKVDQIMKEERTVKTFLKAKFLRLTRGCSIYMFCSMLGVVVTWRVEDG